MKFKRKSKKGNPAISTASLPDIVFMLLFFFMVTTVMKDVDLKVLVKEPDANQVNKLENKDQLVHIYVGPPVDSKYGTLPRIQLADDFAEMKDVATYVQAEIQKMPEPMQAKATTSLKVDQNTEMGIVTDVKQELRKAEALKINYATREMEQ